VPIWSLLNASFTDLKCTTIYVGGVIKARSSHRFSFQWVNLSYIGLQYLFCPVYKWQMADRQLVSKHVDLSNVNTVKLARCLTWCMSVILKVISHIVIETFCYAKSMHPVRVVYIIAFNASTHSLQPYNNILKHYKTIYNRVTWQSHMTTWEIYAVNRLVHYILQAVSLYNV